MADAVISVAGAVVSRSPGAVVTLVGAVVYNICGDFTKIETMK